MALLWGAGQGHDGNVLRGGGNKNTEFGICASSSLQLEKCSLAGGIRAGHIAASCSGERLAETPLLCWGGKQCITKLDQLLQAGRFWFVSFFLLFLWLADVTESEGAVLISISCSCSQYQSSLFFCFSEELGSDLESTDHSCQEEFLNAAEIH